MDLPRIVVPVARMLLYVSSRAATCQAARRIISAEFRMTEKTSRAT